MVQKYIFAIWWTAALNRKKSGNRSLDGASWKQGLKKYTVSKLTHRLIKSFLGHRIELTQKRSALSYIRASHQLLRCLVFNLSPNHLKAVAEKLRFHLLQTSFQAS